MTTNIDALSTDFIENLMAELCKEIRSGNRRTLYGELITDSIVSAVHACFPLLSRDAGDSQIHSWATEFICNHRCAEPQFFKIATEFVRFANESLGLTRLHRSLMEYEWLLLAVEIDNVFAPASESEISMRELWRGEAFLQVNPTLSEIGLPFDVSDITEASAICETDATHGYAVYRSSKHRVYTQRLTDFDRLLLASIRETQTITREAIARHIHHEAPDFFAERWLSHFCKTDAVIFSRKSREISI